MRRDAAAPAGLPPLGELSTVPYPFALAVSEKERVLERWTALAEELGR